MSNNIAIGVIVASAITITIETRRFIKNRRARKEMQTSEAAVATS